MSKCSRGYQSLTYLSPSHFLFSLTTFYPLSAKDVELLTLCCRMQGAGKCCSVLTMFMSHPLCLLRLSGLASDVAQPSAPSLAQWPSPGPACSAAQPRVTQHLECHHPCAHQTSVHCIYWNESGHNHRIFMGFST